MATLFILVNVLVGAAFAWSGVTGLGAVRRRARRATRATPMLVSLLAVLGLLLMEAGVAGAIFAYRSFDPEKTALRMACRLQPGGEPDAPNEIRFDYDPTRQCVHHTFYQFRNEGLDRVVLQNYRRRSGEFVYEMRTLSYRPAFDAPLNRGLFTRVVTGLKGDAYRRLMVTVDQDALTCPPPGDEAARSRTEKDADALRVAAGHIAASDVAAASVTSRWLCAAPPIGKAPKS
jgi:hypothetical protein